YNFVDGGRLATVAAAGIHRAIVFVPTSDWYAWWDYGSVFSANDPLLRGDVIFARDLGPDGNARTLAAFPDRSGFLLANGSLTRPAPSRVGGPADTPWSEAVEYVTIVQHIRMT